MMIHIFLYSHMMTIIPLTHVSFPLLFQILKLIPFLVHLRVVGNKTFFQKLQWHETIETSFNVAQVFDTLLFEMLKLFNLVFEEKGLR